MFIITGDVNGGDAIWSPSWLSIEWDGNAYLNKKNKKDSGIIKKRSSPLT